MTISMMNQEKISQGPHPDLLEAGGEKSQSRETRAKISGEGSQVSSVVTVISPTDVKRTLTAAIVS